MSDNKNKGVIGAVLLSGLLVSGTILWTTGNVSFGFVSRMFEPAYIKAVRSSLESPSSGRFRDISSSLPDGIACGEVSSIERSGVRTPYQPFCRVALNCEMKNRMKSKESFALKPYILPLIMIFCNSQAPPLAGSQVSHLCNGSGLIFL